MRRSRIWLNLWLVLVLAAGLLPAGASVGPCFAHSARNVSGTGQVCHMNCRWGHHCCDQCGARQGVSASNLRRLPRTSVSAPTGCNCEARAATTAGTSPRLVPPSTSPFEPFAATLPPEVAWPVLTPVFQPGILGIDSGPPPSEQSRLNSDRAPPVPVA